MVTGDKNAAVDIVNWFVPETEKEEVTVIRLPAAKLTCAFVTLSVSMVRAALEMEVTVPAAAEPPSSIRLKEEAWDGSLV